MNTTILRSILLAAALVLPACKGGAGHTDPTGGARPVELKTDEQKTLYTLGLMVGRNLTPFHLSAAELETVGAGIADSVAGKKPQVEPQPYAPKIGDLARSRRNDSSGPFLAAAAQEPGAVKLPSGLVFRTLKPGPGPSPTAADTVQVQYQGTLQDGAVFDSSVQRGQPARFALGSVMPCWTEALQRMKAGEKAKLTCPAALAYGDRGQPPKVPGGATLAFEIELLSIEKKPEIAAAPATPVAPAAPATRVRHR